VGKLLKKLGAAYLRKVTPKKHHPLLDYIERARRKRVNKQKRDRLMVLMGKAPEEEKAATGVPADDSDSDDEMDSADDDVSEKYS